MVSSPPRKGELEGDHAIKERTVSLLAGCSDPLFPLAIEARPATHGLTQ